MGSLALKRKSKWDVHEPEAKGTHVMSLEPEAKPERGVRGRFYEFRAYHVIVVLQARNGLESLPVWPAGAFLLQCQEFSVSVHLVLLLGAGQYRVQSEIDFPAILEVVARVPVVVVSPHLRMRAVQNCHHPACRGGDLLLQKFRDRIQALLETVAEGHIAGPELFWHVLEEEDVEGEIVPVLRLTVDPLPAFESVTADVRAILCGIQQPVMHAGSEPSVDALCLVLCWHELNDDRKVFERLARPPLLAAAAERLSELARIGPGVERALQRGPPA
mmetsp:Transcript_16201/g.39096  ORF Transcript_16201/g.39096 Transcript_16201/m.39096 type:complete len:274 (+) Transcript_16201:175-996(+)